MKVSPTIDLAEMVQILREGLANRTGCEIDCIVIESHGSPKITIDAFDMVEAVEFRHRAVS